MKDKPPMCSATIFGPRVHSWSCARRGVVQRDGKWFCRQHDPEAEKARRKARDAKWKAVCDANEAIEAEGENMAKRLGCGTPHFQTRLRGRSGYTRHLVLSFEEIETLLKRLDGQEG